MGTQNSFSGTLRKGFPFGQYDKLAATSFTDLPGSSIALSSALVNTIEISASSLLYASHVAYLQDIAFSEPPVTFNASTNSVRFILSQPTHDVSRKSFITAARNDRHLTVFRKGLSSLVGTLRTEGEVMSMDLSSSAPSSPSQSTAHGYPNESKEILVIVNQDGGLEIFPKPFDFAEHTQQNGLSSTKDRMKGRSRRSATQVNLKASGKDPHFVPIISVSIQGCYLLAAWVVAGVNLRFERIKWQDEATGELVLHGAVEVPCEPGETFEVEGSANETRKMGKNRLNESNAVVMNGSGNTDTVQEDKAPIVIDISSAEENSSSDAETEDSAPVQSTTATSIPERFDSDAVTPGKRDLESTASIQQAGQVLSSQAEPTFAELLRAGAPKPIDLSESHQDLLEAGRPANSDITLQQTAPGLSLSTVLSQSLKTNDKRLLQSCLQNRDLATVRTTIERLNPELAPGLMQKLAQLLHSRPGRAGSLLVWVQWTLIAHGGSLAGRADVMKDLRSLHDVVKQRANSLQSLLTLKGKLDMLEAQMNIRNRLKKNSKRIEDTDEGAILYVEGQSEEDSDFDGGSNDDSSAADDAHIQNAIGAQTRVLEGVHDKNADSSDRLLTTDSGFMASEDTESEEGISANEGLSTEDESEDESSSGEVDYDDVDTISTDGAASPLTNGINDVD